MLFSTVYFPDEIEDVENKLRLNLSDYAFSVLNYDMEAFHLCQPDSKRIPSAVINQVFFCFKDIATSSIALSTNTKKEELATLFEGLECSERAVDRMVNAYKKELIAATSERLKIRSNPFSIRVDERNLEYLRSDDGQAESIYYNDRVGLYIKALVEEYCQLPYVMREKMFFRDNLNEITRAVNEAKTVKLKLQSQRKSSEREQNNIIYMRPFCVEDDSEHMYNYIAGMAAPTQGGPWKLQAIRLSNIQKAEYQKKAGFLSADERKYIRGKINRLGIQYLSDDPELTKVVVQFTPYGEKQYRQIMHLRPTYTKKSGLIYEFYCPLFQATTYFFKFGHNAKVLAPQSLADLFKRRYESAAKQYE